MNEEGLSALLDGECSPAEVDRLLDEIERSPALQAKFTRMSMARDSLQGLRLRRGLDLADRVQAALSGEAVPAAAPAANDARLRWPAVAGLALAAGVAAAVVFVVRPDRAPEAPAPVVAAATPAAPAQLADRDAAWGELAGQDARELNDYMVAHSRSRAQLGQGMGGTLGYARYTAYSAKYQSADDAH